MAKPTGSQYRYTLITGEGTADTRLDTECSTTYEVANEFTQSFRALTSQLISVYLKAIPRIASNEVDINIYKGLGVGGTLVYDATTFIPIGEEIDHTLVGGALAIEDDAVYTIQIIGVAEIDVLTTPTVYPSGVANKKVGASYVSIDNIQGEFRFGDVEIDTDYFFPFPEGNVKIVYEQDDGQVFWRKKLSGRFTICKDDDPTVYAKLKAIADSRTCEESTFLIHCGSELEFKGVIRRQNVKVNLTKCCISFNADPLDEYTCLLDNYERDFGISGDPITVVQPPESATYESESYFVYIRLSDFSAAGSPSPSYAVGTSGPVGPDLYAGTNGSIASGSERCWTVTTITGPPAFSTTEPYVTAGDPQTPNHWCVDSYTSRIVEDYDTPPGTDLFVKLETTWHRELITVTTGGTPEGSGWILRYTSGGFDYYWRCPKVKCTIGDEFDQGRLLSDVVSSAGAECGLGAVSHLINIGTPDYDEPVNKEYLAKDDYQYLTFHAKSDVKRPNATSPASLSEFRLTPKELLDIILFSRLQMKWDIYKDQIRVEHISFYEPEIGEDLTLADASDFEYESAEAGVPTQEDFESMDDVENEYFEGVPIIYDTCVTEGPKDISDSLTTSDICALLNDNPEASDDGFVIIAANDVSPDATIIDGNTPMSWTELHTNFWRYARPLGFGNMNGEDTDFDNPDGFRKMTVSKKLCCGEVFEPNELKRTRLGLARVVKAELDMKTRILSIELLH